MDVVCNTGLGLGLGSQKGQFQSDHHLQQPKMKRRCLKYDHMLPSLTLGLPEEVSSSPSDTLSAVSSFSNSSVKKEKDDQFGGGGGGGEEAEEVEVERAVSPRIHGTDQEDEEGSPRKKLRLTKEQSAILEDNFKEHSTLNPKQKQALAEQLNLRPRQVEVWFQNRRARTKLKQTEVEFVLLKKCCETLTEENKRLQKELQELRSLKIAAPLYMQRPAATLSMCPSCERIGGGGVSGGSSTSGFSVGPPKPHFYNAFTHPSAAC